jgi:hypothetical protein
MTQQVSVSLAKDSPTNMLAGSFKERIVEKKKTGQGVFHNDYYKLFHQNSLGIEKVELYKVDTKLIIQKRDNIVK